MAQKALKTLAARNAQTLNRTHLITLAVHLFYHILRFIFVSRSLLPVSRSLLPYTLCSAPQLIIEIWFERIGRPTYSSRPDGQPELKKAGEDLEAKGLTEWMWDVVYWTWGCVVLVAVVGDWGWWAYGVVPAYSAWLAFSTYSGVKSGMGGLMGGGAGGEGSASGGQSKRQAKMEKRGGQRVYR